ncbi:MAG: RING finger protein [Candidatus Hodarchaeota archaeon]
MSTNAARLPRLSRNKNTGNIIILISLCIGFISTLNIYNSNLLITYDKIFLIGSGVFTLLFSYLINKHLRKPFFIAFTDYIRELSDRRLDTQQIAVKIDLIEPLQTLSGLKLVLNQVDKLQGDIKKILNQTSYEISMNISPIRSTRVQKELKLIERLAQESLEEVEKKRNNLIFLARTRKYILDTINNYTSRPQNEIETDYLLFKLRKHLKDQIVDDILLNRIVRHALNGGEIKGRLERNENGDIILFVDNSLDNVNIHSISWDHSDRSEEFCVICRHIIQESEVRIICPFCQNVFHRGHLLEWLKVFNQCPMCYNRITLFSNSNEGSGSSN